MTPEPDSVLDRLADEWPLAFDVVGDLVCLLAADGTVLRCNPGMAEFLGLRPEDAVGRKCYELMHGTTVFFPDCPLAEMLRSGRRETFELPLGRRWFQVTADPVVLDGEIAGAVHIVRDVTEFRVAIDSAAERSRRLEAVTDLAIDLAALPGETDLSAFLATRLLELTQAVGVSFAEYEAAERMLTMRAIKLRPGALQKLTAPLLRRLERIRAPIDEGAYAEILANTNNIRGTLTEASFGDIPPHVDRAVRRLLDVDRFLGLAYVVEGQVYGTSVLALQTGAPDPPADLLDAFSHLAAVSLRRWMAEREAELAARQIRELNAGLEERVRERTLELAVANRDLQEFVYSVAHDLRTPLRAVDGFSLAVLEEHGHALGEDGRSDLRRVRAAAQTMGDLIDALLALTRVGRREVKIERVDLTAVARKVVEELRAAAPERRVEVRVAEGLYAETDAALAEIVLRNLLGNAWKFTSGKGLTHLAVGLVDRPEGPAFFVQDDGAGFDPAYTDKLFSPFQRLHPPAEYPGTGIGLATVKRALERLGGEWRAEGNPGAGATFFFTFGPPEEAQ